jgi:hypothetical protein
VAFWWTDEHGKRQQGEGSSRDISEDGAFVFAPNCPPFGASVGLKMDLEGLPNATEPFPIEYQGQVVRVERPNGDSASGFAVLRSSS